MRTLLIAFACFTLAACGGKPDGDAALAQGSGAPGVTGKDGNKNACRLLTPAEVEALVEQPIGIGSVEEAMPAYSKCHWEDTKGNLIFAIEVWWAGGKQQWEIQKGGMKAAGAMLEKAEGVGIDSVLPQGPVSGIGDAATFSEILPSHILQGDRFIELLLVMVPNASTKFRGLAQTLLSRM